jgi:two-component system chemotaxis sensor kinase CheA
MADTTHDHGTSDGIDLTQFYQVFFEEAGENLEAMEQKLLELDLSAADDEELNAIFRCAHSVKGGAATFGFSDVAELTHQMETLLDKLRRHELQPTAQMVDVLLEAGDALKALLARHQGSGADAPTPPRWSPTSAPWPKAAPPRPRQPAPRRRRPPRPAPVAAAAAMPGGARAVELRVGPLEHPEQADNLAELFKEITNLGTIEPLDAGHAADGIRRFRIVTTTSDNDLLDLFTFHVAREVMQLLPMGPGYGFHEGAPGAPEAEPGRGTGLRLLRRRAGRPGAAPAPGARRPAAPAAAAPAAPPLPRPQGRPKAEAKGGGMDSTTLRVSVEKVDQLINLVGELVITQAMLAQNSRNVDATLNQQLLSGLADLERNTRDLQEAVMSIRMIPMSMVFNRFPACCATWPASWARRSSWSPRAKPPNWTRAWSRRSPTR